jgi:hypothetical protein
MKNIFLHFIAAVFFLLPAMGFSQTTGSADTKCYSAFIDNDIFTLQNNQPVNAVVSFSNDGDAKTMVSITVAGDESNEKIRLNLALLEPVSPGPANCSATLNHNSTTYAMLKGDGSNIEVTDFIWSQDRKSFIISLSYNCTMRSLGYPTDGKADVNLKGKLLRVRVTLPGLVSASE